MKIGLTGMRLTGMTATCAGLPYMVVLASVFASYVATSMPHHTWSGGNKACMCSLQYTQKP